MEYSTNDKIHTSCVETILEVIDNRKEDFCHEDIICNCSNTIIEVDVSNNSIDLEKILELYDFVSKKFEGIHVSIRC